MVEKQDSNKKNIDFNKPAEPELLPAPTNNNETFIDPETVDKNQEKEVKKNRRIKIETPIGTQLEMSQEQIENLSNQNREKTKFQKDLNNILVSVSQERLDKITDALKKNFIKLERVKNDKSGVVVENKEYVPITWGQNKQVMKAMKRARLLREDITGMGQKGGLSTTELHKKYPDIIDEDVLLDELQNPDVLNEFVGNYVIAQKAKIYWGIEDVENYVLSDLVLLIGLYEQRNNFTNS